MAKFGRMPNRASSKIGTVVESLARGVKGPTRTARACLPWRQVGGQNRFRSIQLAAAQRGVRAAILTPSP
jgi:hypothetical protein